MFEETEIVKQVKALAENPLVQLTSDHWRSLLQAFSQHFPALRRELANQGANTNTMRVCMLTVIGIRTGEQSNLMGIKKQAVTNCKTALNSLLFNEKTSRTLYKNLASQYNIFML